jgi:hypothetical protein
MVISQSIDQHHHHHSTATAAAAAKPHSHTPIPSIDSLTQLLRQLNYCFLGTHSGRSSGTSMPLKMDEHPSIENHAPVTITQAKDREKSKRAGE